jgi:hypothetical protein
VNYADPLVLKAQKREARDMGVRLRVCENCIEPGDHELGWIHSELPCHRCGAKPCAGVVVLTS